MDIGLCKGDRLAQVLPGAHAAKPRPSASAVELGAHRITVNAVCPNHVTTGLGAEQIAYFSKLLGFDSIEAYLANMATKNPMDRPGLASDDACYVTGEAINVTGGEEMH